MFRNSSNSYGFVAKLFHWLSAIVIFILFFLGIWMIDLDYEHDWYDLAVHYHESIGILLTLFIVMRLFWRWFDNKPAPSLSLSVWEKKSAVIVHFLLYLLCLFIFFSGYLIPTADHRSIDVFSWFTVPSIGSIHHFIDKDNTLKKIL
jgi:cytochrome b561